MPAAPQKDAMARGRSPAPRPRRRSQRINLKALRDDIPAKVAGSPRGYRRGEPKLYVDQRTIIREVVDLRELRRGDHCMCPLNLARGSWRWLDRLVDHLAALELNRFTHHFILLDDVRFVGDDGIPRVEEGGREAFCAEYTNTPEDFALHARRVGYSGALLDKATFRKTGMAGYGKGSLIYKVVEANALSDTDRQRIVDKAAATIANGGKGSLPSYNLLSANCEHVANHMSGVRHGVQAWRLTRSPMVNFALWNIFRFMLQLVGVAFLWHFDAGWSASVLALYILLTAIPVFLQSLYLFVSASSKIHGMFQRGRIKARAYRHLLWKESFRLLLVGVGSTALIVKIPFLVGWEEVQVEEQPWWPTPFWSAEAKRFPRKRDLLLAGFAATFVFYLLNSLYGVLAKTGLVLVRRALRLDRKRR